MGGTFQRLFHFIKSWTLEDKLDFNSVAIKTSFIGITQKTKNSPNTWRWQQKAAWVKEHPKVSIKNVSVPAELWDYLGNLQPKVSKTNYPEKWGSDEILLPPRESSNLQALKQAYLVYCLGLEQKQQFAEKLATTQEFKDSWLRSMASELKNSA